MRILRIFAVVTLLILWGALPALACLLPQRALSPAEMKCCAQMAGNCGGKMQTSHSCCKPVANQGVAALTAASQAQSLALVAVTAPLSQGSLILAPLRVMREQHVHPPPNRDAPSIEILRI